MVDEVFDLDENSVYPSIIKPSYLFARGCGKSQIQLQLYDAILKGEINMAGVYMAGDFRNGTTFEMDGGVFRVVEFQHVKPGKGAAFVRTKLKNVITGAVLEKTFNPSEKLQGAEIEKKEMQYLYNDGGLYYFMDNETYEQINIPADRLEWEKQFLTESMNVNISIYEGEVLGVMLPDKVTLRIVECEPAVKGNTATSASKNAKLETGLEIRVPLFIENDELVLINTADGKYSGRA